MAAQADSSVVGIAAVTPEGEVQRMNKAWEQMWGVDAELLRSDRERATRIMLDKCADPDAFVAGVERLAATGGGEYLDEIALKDGRVIERYATHVRSEAGEVIGRIWFHTDITEHRREEDALRFLADATTLLSSSLEYETTLGHIVELAVPRLADWCMVEVAEPTGTRTVGRARVSEPADAEAVRVPIQVRDRHYGTINLFRAPGHRFENRDLKLAEELARRAAIAIDNSRVHAELRQTARTLQESLLPPHLPAVRGMELAARFRPAGAGMQVGGDFYDIFEVAPGRWAITVGDVCGKGAEAAAVTALTRYTVRTAAMYEADVCSVLRMLNQALLRQRADCRFTTLVFCVIDVEGERRSLRAACGGHPRPLLRRPNGSVQAFGAAGPLLGVFADAEFHEDEVDLEDDDVLVLYTDGLTDAFAPQQILGERALLDALADCGGMTAAEVASRMEDTALRGDRTRVPRDDIALVVAKLG
jgi:PAS domain S-box-containing protein